MSETATTSSGLSLPGAVFIVFLVLKLTNVIDWSWWWVTAPLWISALAFVWFFTVALLALAIRGR